LVIVADTKTPSDYMETEGLRDNSRVHYLSIEDQEQWGDVAVSAFIASVPYRHFACPESTTGSQWIAMNIATWETLRQSLTCT